jgi:hypothetical protein
MKRITVLLFVFLTFPVYSQNLEPGDADLFFDTIETFDSIFGAMPEETDPVWRRYQETGERLTSEFMLLLQSPGSEDGPGAVKNFKSLLDEFFSLEVPETVEDAFRQAGWKKNGNKKVFTLLFGISICALYEELETGTRSGLENPAAKTLSNIKGIFAPSDWEIIQATFGRFKEKR